MMTILSCQAQNSEMKNIEQTIVAFSQAGDENNATKLATYLDDNFRIVMNRLFGSTEVSIMPRAVYLEKIKSKEFGGDQRTVTIQNIETNGNSACAKVNFKGTKMTFVSLILFIQNSSGEWKLVNETPIVKQ